MGESNRAELPSEQGEDRRWLFGSAVLDERTLELTVSGEAVALERKSLQLLLHLLRHAGEVVTKDEILDAVWPGRIISESGLTTTIYRLRAALRDENQDIIKTQHGYGYRLVAPVKVQASAEVTAAKLGLSIGDHPPLRPLWSLRAKLGRGGHGEAWLGSHDKTGDTRIFKFATDARHLAPLKREITLYRLLKDSLGDSAAIVPILDWNLEEPPYFIETEHIRDGSLVQWAEARGGVGKVPFETRLDIAAQVAEALAAAHSIGVLHKDLKPSNILIDQGRIRLADFGSGSVLDTTRLEALGITRMGFTKTAMLPESTAGTLAYLAPEVIAGQPFTIQADVYSLGIVLYQLVVADFQRALAPGWERDVADEALREDIAAAAEGDPARRLGDAALLGQRLRGLDQRRRQRIADAEAAEKERIAARQMERAHARRRWVQATFAALVTGFAVAITLYVRASVARSEAEKSAAVAEAVNEFLNKDLLGSADPVGGSIKDLTLKDVVDRASGAVDQRLANQPEAAARVHDTLGQVYLWGGDMSASRSHWERAADLYARSYGPDSVQRIRTLGRLALPYLGALDVKNMCAAADAAWSAVQKQPAATPVDILRARFNRADCVRMRDTDLGWGAGHEEFGQIKRELEQIGIPDAWLYAEVVNRYAYAFHASASTWGEAVSVRRALVEYLAKARGEHDILTTRERYYLGVILTVSGRFEEAERQLLQGAADQAAWVGGRGSTIVDFDNALGMLRLEQGRIAEANHHLERFMDNPAFASYVAGEKQLAKMNLAETRLLLGRFDEASSLAREVLEFTREAGWPARAYDLECRAVWADALRQQGRRTEAWAVLRKVPDADITWSGEGVARFRRSQALLWLEEGKRTEAERAFGLALEALEKGAGQDSWRTRRAREDLARARGHGASVRNL